jgi:hypothetical protein
VQAEGAVRYNPQTRAGAEEAGDDAEQQPEYAQRLEHRHEARAAQGADLAQLPDLARVLGCGLGRRDEHSDDQEGQHKRRSGCERIEPKRDREVVQAPERMRAGGSGNQQQCRGSRRGGNAGHVDLAQQACRARSSRT